MKKKLLAILLCSLMTISACGCGASLVETALAPFNILQKAKQAIFGTDFVVNEYTMPEKKETPPAGLKVYGGEDIGFSFLYPSDMTVSWNDTDGACISNGNDMVPYVLVNKTSKGGMTPEKYFDSTNKQILKQFDDVKSTTIHQVPLQGKTLYMTRYQCSSGNENLVIDRYLEIYDDCYIQYTVASNTADEMNTAMYYAATTLSPEEGCYVGEISDQLNTYQQGDTGISIKIPDMLEVKTLTMGYFASYDDAIMLAVLCTQDDNGNPIYNRQNFMDCAAASPDFVAGYLGADSTVFGSGQAETINGVEYYAYPMTMQTGDEQFSGKIYLANASENGCYVVCYAVNEASPNFEKVSELCLEGINSIEIMK